MSVTNEFELRAVETLWVDRAKRQRREILTPEGNFINSDGLVESVRERGVLSALLCHRSGEIIFGERRWTAAKLSNTSHVPVRYVEDMPELEARKIELEENLRRKDLSWRDYVAAVSGLHATYEEQAAQRGAEWSKKATAKELQLSEGLVSELLRVGEDLESPRIARATSYREAYNALARIDERRSAEVMEGILSATSESMAELLGEPGGTGQQGEGAGVADIGGDNSNAPAGTPTGRGTESGPASVAYPSGGSPLRVAREPAAPDSILQADFCEWATSYTGPRFNLIHCDFPYGVNLFGGAWGGKGSTEAYEDTQDVYEKLIHALCVNRERLMAHQAHLVFWLSADVEIMWRTREMFRSLAPELWFWPMPLVWHKTDNMGIASDPQRRGRHVYEVALVASREDRKIVKVVSDCYGAPTDKRYHPSTKPEPVLKTFLCALVDEHTRVLDPTCGSGSALRAAEALGAESVLGLELDPEHAKTARSAMRQFRALRAAEKLGQGA